MEENNQEMPVVKKNNKNALASFIVALVGLIIAGIPCGIASAILGVLGITKFNPETEKGKWMAIVGLILGIIDIIAVVAILPSLYKSLGIL